MASMKDLVIAFLTPAPLWVTALPLAPLLIYLAIVALGAFLADRLHFSRYRLRLISGVPSAALGCILLPTIAFPLILFTCLRIRRNMLHQRTPGEHPPSIPSQFARMAAVLAADIVIVFFLIAFSPNNHIRYKEFSAVLSLRNYATAQEAFLKDELAKIPGNNRKPVGYCDNYRNLFYGTPSSLSESGRRQPGPHYLALISLAHADAFAAPTAGAPTAGDHVTTANRYEGYLFLEDPHIVATDDWENDCALVAYPIRAGVDGRYVFWVGREAKVLQASMPLPEGDPPALLVPGQSPLARHPTLDWQECRIREYHTGTNHRPEDRERTKPWTRP